MEISRLVLLSLIGITVVCDNVLVDYYESLIMEEIRRAATYTFPKDAGNYRPFNEKPLMFGVVDFIVIGSGSSGSVVASRLSENGNWTVLLIEAGGEESNFTDIPAMSNYAASLEYNWGFNSTPQDTCCLAMNGICPFPRGKSLGGSTAINALGYARGNELDYDKWSEENPGWSYQDVLPYFIKSENSHIDDGDEGYHGYGGYLNVEHHVPTSKKVYTFLQANEELGKPIIDYNGYNQLGASRSQFNTIHGRRQSSSKAFLAPDVRSRRNLKISTHSYVTKILINDTTKTAYAVQFSHNNIQYVAKIKKEIVLSAGVVGSPTILMHSGIGPKQHLKELNIPIVKDLEVGEHMHDHLTFYSIQFTSSIFDPVYTLRESITQYLNGFGPLTTAVNTQGIAFFQLSTRNTTVPDLEVLFIPTVPANTSGYVHVGERMWRRSYDTQVSQIILVLLHPKTRGRIFLNSNDSFVYPLIDSKCLSDEGNEDVESIYRGIEKVMELFDTEAFRGINATLLPDPRCTDRTFRSRAYWMCLIRLTALNAYHGGGTCQMGPHPSMGAVVDNKLKVYGIKNLRVADTSIIPVTLSGHMSAPAMMVGERVSDFIKKDHGFIH
ncbi:hypothetical protein RI129_012540 [Pyrocoelia pectoralis]|uniref:Glucose-methanol-choline oxidoreductase N-terminal domain-containing protein n=1 Tax=Pyrocoelia pectoralis TaxID=417401 RepID=A0AAN7UTJ9_9COLE